MSITAGSISLIESLLQHDRPAAWWGLDSTGGETVDDSGNAYTLTAIGTPSNAASLHTRGDTGASGSRDFNGTTGGYFTAGSVTTTPEGPPPFHAISGGLPVTTTTQGRVVSPAGVAVGDLMLTVLAHGTQTATISATPTGWTQVGTTLNCTDHAATIYKRTADADDLVQQEHVWTWSASATTWTTMLIYRSLDPDVSGLIFDSGQQASNGTLLATTSESHPGQSRRLVILTHEIASTITANPANVNMRSSTTDPIWVADFEAETAGSGAITATAAPSVNYGAFLLTFGSPPKVLSDALDAISETITIGCLVNLDTVSGTDTIVRKHQSWGLHLAAGVLTFLYRDGGGTDRTVSGPTLATGTTYRLWVVDDGTNIAFYVNGTKTPAARTGTAGYTQNSNRVSIAHYNDNSTNANFLDGRLDELAVFAAPFSQQMVMAHEIAATQGTFGGYLVAGKSTRYPRAKLELSLTSNPTARCHSFSDVTVNVRANEGIQTQRGRNFELDRMQAGTMSFVLDNRDRAYDDVKPTRVVRFRAQVSADGPVFPIFFGYTDAPKYNRPSFGMDSTVSFAATDIFKALSLDKVREAFVRPSEYAGERLAAVLGEVAGLSVSVDVGAHLVIGDDLQGVNRLEHCQAVGETDGGIFFADGRGRAVFQDNLYRSKNERTVRATYGGQNTSAPYPCKDLTPEVDEGRLYTAASVTPASGNVQRSINEDAALEFFERTKEMTTLHASDADALAMAHHIVNAYSVPLERIPNLRLQPGAFASPAVMWAAVLVHEISHRVKTIEKPIGGTSEVPREHFIEGVHMQVSSNDWQVVFSCSPVELDGKYFRIGTSVIDGADVIGW